MRFLGPFVLLLTLASTSMAGQPGSGRTPGPCELLLAKMESILGRKGDVPVDPAVAGSGSTTTTLTPKERSAVASELRGMVARRSSVEAGSDGYFEMLASYLDARIALPEVLREVESHEKLLPDLADLEVLLPEEPGWKQTAALAARPYVAGVASLEGETTVFLRGTQGLHAVRFAGTSPVRVIEPSKLYEEYLRVCEREVSHYATQGLKLLQIHAFSDRYEVVLPDGRRFRLSSEEFLDFCHGKLSTEHPLAAALRLTSGEPMLTYANPLMRKPGRHLDDHRNFSFAAQRYTSQPFLGRDPLSPETESKFASLREFEVARNNTYAIVASDSLRREDRPEDFRLAGNLMEVFRQNGIEVIRVGDGDGFSWEHGQGNGVIVITGHSDERLKAFVRHLGEAGAFRGNAIVFNSCETPLTDEMISEMNSRYGALAVYQLDGRPGDGKVTIYEVYPFVEEIARRLKESGRNFGRLLFEAVREAGVNGLWTICRREQPGAVTAS